MQNTLSDYKEAYWRGSKISYYELYGQKMILGDIAIADDELSDKPQNATMKKGSGYFASGKWRNNTVDYVFSGGTTARRNDILTAMRYWTEATGIKFRAVDPAKRFHVRITFDSRGGNRAALGFQRVYGQLCNLANGGVGIAVHELGHTIGMVHEQNRSDRDTYIRINWDNIRPEWRSEYEALDSGEDQINSDSFSGFDYRSIMLYPSFANSSGVFNTSIPAMQHYDGFTWGDNIYSGTNRPSAVDAAWVKQRYDL